MDCRQTMRAALLPLGLLLLSCLNGCASIPYDYPRPVSSALYRPEGTSLGEDFRPRRLSTRGLRGFTFCLPGLMPFPAEPA